MKKLWLLLLAMAVPLQFIHAQEVKHAPGPPIPVQVHQTAKTLRDLCREYVATGDEYHLDARACLGYVQGAIDALTLAMVNFQFEAKACVPPMATTEDLVRVTLKYIDGHPERLSYSAADIVWIAMIASYPCSAK